jgi:hypothetical protein
MQQAINQSGSILDRAPRGHDGRFDGLTCALVGRHTTALPADRPVQPAGRGQFPDKERQHTVNCLARVDPHVAAYRRRRQQLFLAPKSK